MSDQITDGLTHFNLGGCLKEVIRIFDKIHLNIMRETMQNTDSTFLTNMG